MKNIVETAIAAENFTTLVKAVGAADLVDTLSGPGAFTVFAPTDAAFAKVPSGVLDSVLKDNLLLSNIAYCVSLRASCKVPATRLTAIT